MNSHMQLKTLIGYLGILILLSSCATDHVAENHQYTPHNKKSYVVRGHNYSFAIYNGEHRLLTHPIEDLLAEMKWRKSLDKPAISDIYVVSHGWNFTLATAMANYHNYMERVDAFMEKQKDSLANQERCKPSVVDGKDVSSSCFQPYFIFINWTSTTRPTTDLAKAVLPFGMDSAVEPLTSVIDKVPLHMLTAWKQSLNAAHNALGMHYPNSYIGKDWGMEPYGYLDSNLIEDADSTMGEDIPVSALIYKLIQQKKEDKQALEGRCKDKKPDPFDPNDDLCVPLAQTKLHLVGHSYGAKLVTLAGMEALRRMMLDEISPPITESLKSQRKNHPTTDREYVECTDSNNSGEETTWKDSAWYKLGHRTVFIEEVMDFQEKDKYQPCLEGVYNKYGKLDKEFFGIESLVLFNPAFSPGELSYPVEFAMSAPIDTLRFIPRKAIVYSNSDYANGALFSVRDLFLNTQISQYSQSTISEFTNFDGDKLTPTQKIAHTPGIKHLFQAGVGAGSLGYGVVYSLIGYGMTSVINFPLDFLHHVQTGTLDGWFSPESDSELSFKSLGKNLVNSVDFFLPIKLTRLFGNPTQGLSLNSPLVFQRDEAEQGLFRLSRSGLGKTGLNHLTEGRWTEVSLWGLADYYCDRSNKESCQKEGYSVEQLKNIDLEARTSLAEFTPFAPNIDPETFCRFNAKLPLTEKGFKSDFEPKKLRWLREKFYSFDASKVYDSNTFLIGAHSDLRKTGIPDADNCWNVSEECQHLEKRDYTFNFMLNFTKTDFEQELCELNPKEMQKSGVICSPKESGK